MLRLKAKPFKILIDDFYLPAEIVNVLRGPRCTGLVWAALAGVIHNSSKGFCVTSGTQNISAQCWKKWQKNCKEKEILEVLKITDWISNCSSPPLTCLSLGRELGWGSTGLGVDGLGVVGTRDTTCQTAQRWRGRRTQWWQTLRASVHRSKQGPFPWGSVIRKSQDRFGRGCLQLETLQAQQWAPGVHPNHSTDG